MKINSSDITSACAICLTLYGLYATRRHYRLSMTPHITGCSNKNLTDQGFTLTYVVSNNGIGPARIKTFTLFNNGKIFPRGNGDYVETLISEHLGTQTNYQILYNFSFGEDASLKSGETCRIAEIFFPGVKSEGREKILTIVKGMDLRIEYESFYCEKFIFDTRCGNKML